MMFKDLKSLEDNEKILKNDILKVLKKYAKNISVFDIMNSTSRFRDTCKYVQDEYKGHFDDIYVKNFYMRIKDIKMDENRYDGHVNKKLFLKAIDYFQKQDEKREYADDSSSYRLIYYLICIYTTFVLDEPIHHEGSVFPGHEKVKYENSVYYCPVKANNSNNPKAVCRYCIAKQG
ncbi:hypothetical protein ALNOE001_02830 [Candidatus Methanobinarius endosymbioticus]|uniref:UPF0305 protein ALNOE001_02830 n=1 Tax=Candidatus Methanobinarius endosymbioticus TaxID=2006182 RepID=A0A366MDU6_9EURY|nr:hypothetical protein ALNOE001_02830 [Candidatus Methanobinarius endosymbioticus]